MNLSQKEERERERPGLEIGMGDPWAVIEVYSVGQRQRE